MDLGQMLFSTALTLTARINSWVSDRVVEWHNSYFPVKHCLGACGEGSTFGQRIVVEGSKKNIFLGKHVRIGNGARLVCSG